MPIAIVIAIFVAIGIGISVAQESARKKKQAEAESAMKKFDEKEELKQYVNPSAAKKSTTSRPPTVSAQTTNAQSSAQAQARLASRLQQLQKVESEIRAMSHHDDEYCAVKHESTDRFKVEKVPVMNSIGGKSTEGCADHYDLRYVKIDEQATEPRELTDLQKVVVYGEVINQPAFKRKYRR
ncbi:MAG: hypothetical protein K2O08_02150 [Clostridia bacterium]|nr:hypothetical protein [Clostridia bacterium]